MSVLWILGSADAEMSAIESLLRECGQSANIYHATRDGRLVRPGEPATGAHRLLRDGALGDAWEADLGEPVAIEVAGPWGSPVIDHHDEHPLASAPPREFMAASSLGQVIGRLAQMGVLPSSWPVEEVIDIREQRGTIATAGQGWFVWLGLTGATQDRGGLGEFFVGRVAYIPQALVMEAAADHCPAAAIAGRCPGMDPGAFAPFLAESKRRQYFPWMSPEEFARELDRSRATLRSAPPCVELCPPAQWMGAAEAGDEWGDLVAIGPHTGVRPVVRDLRHLEPGTVPAQGSGECYPAEFLVGIVAAIFEGVGFVCRIRRKDGKLALRSNGHGLGSLAGTRPAEVFLSDPSAFGCGPRFPPGQDASYGNPVRGFFGGLLIDQG